jgi:G3E family GTPase
MMPVSVITGFLGSGKTTMLSHLLRQPAFADTAVIINEFGEIGLDHDLIETSDETTVTLQTGCLCCKMQDDLVRTLHDLLARRREGAVPPFARVVVETSGLADPAPILQSLMMDETAAANFPLARVVTVVDAVTGGGSLANHLEAQHQLAVADHVVVSKTPQATAGGSPRRCCSPKGGRTVARCSTPSNGCSRPAPRVTARFSTIATDTPARRMP